MSEDALLPEGESSPEEEPKRRPGRPRKADSGEAVPRRRRRRRIDLSAEGRLRLRVPVETDENYAYSWIREESVEGYTTADDWDQVEKDGVPITVNGGQGVTMHLVRKPKDWYESDVAEEQSRIVDISQSRARDADVGAGGTEREPNAQGFYDKPSHNADSMLR